MKNPDLENLLPESQSEFIYTLSVTSDNIYWAIGYLTIAVVVNMILGYFVMKWIIGRFNK